MSNENQELLSYIQTFEKMLDKTPDEERSLHEFVKLYRGLIRLKPKECTIPMIEITSVLKVKKPTVFHALRKHGKSDPFYQTITSSVMEEELALERLETLKHQLGSSSSL
ncbi:hypothetical protein [Salsuginibacillus kocurii]|uniref:hypothetical protein n=1 Tax=Salsuginibacillus kocurii TaxID=427078 RepID=UPI00036BED45|nr:hypothetical protein [Salsuginibacillus kocurii]